MVLEALFNDPVDVPAVRVPIVDGPSALEDGRGGFPGVGDAAFFEGGGVHVVHVIPVQAVGDSAAGGQRGDEKARYPTNVCRAVRNHG